jgi:hypothetical protein
MILSCASLLSRYHKQGATIVREFCQQRRGQCSAAQVALQLTKFAVDVLRLLPPAGSAAERDGAGNVVRAPAVTPAQVLARQPSWLLLSEESSFQVLDVCIRSCGIGFNVSTVHCRSYSTWRC